MPYYVSGPSQVIVYPRAPAVYQEIGTVEADRVGLLPFGTESRFQDSLENLKEKAAKLGANGVIVSQLGDYKNAATAVAYGARNAYGDEKPSALLRTSGPLLGVAIWTERN